MVVEDGGWPASNSIEFVALSAVSNKDAPHDFQVQVHERRHHGGFSEKNLHFKLKIAKM